MTRLKALKAFESILKARKTNRCRRLSNAPLSIHTHKLIRSQQTKRDRPDGLREKTGTPTGTQPLLDSGEVEKPTATQRPRQSGTAGAPCTVKSQKRVFRQKRFTQFHALG
jgi:hypothetical protein